MKNQHSYYFNELLTKCIYVTTPDKCPSLRIGETIGVLQEYAKDYSKDLFQGEPIELIESPQAFINDVEYILEAMESNDKHWKQSITDRLKTVIGRAERRGKALSEMQSVVRNSPTDDRRRILQNAADSINSMADYLEYSMRTMSPNMIPIAAEDLASAKSSAMELKKEFSLE